MNSHLHSALGALAVFCAALALVTGRSEAGELRIEGDVKQTTVLGNSTTAGHGATSTFSSIKGGATIKGEVVADDVVVNGRIVGRVRGLKVRLTSTARVEGDIIHKTIAIESGAHFEGSVQRQDDPLGGSKTTPPTPKPAPKPAG